MFFLWKYSSELPSYEELKNYNPNLSSRVFTSDGILLDKYFIEERIFVPIDRIPDNLINAFISAEDKNFFYHKGIDPLAILRAIYTNLFNKVTKKKNDWSFNYFSTSC
ncbi:MAG: transglycosylase domain-containing protein [Alphaproteobacteria bacterium]